MNLALYKNYVPKMKKHSEIKNYKLYIIQNRPKVIALPLGGFLCINGFDGGWPSIFYVFGKIRKNTF